jgi:hypothetical protein
VSFASSRLRASRLPVLVGSRENAGARAGVVVAATGALVAAFAGPAHAATTPAAVPAAPVRVAAAPAVASAAPAVTAPRAAAPLRTAFGVIGVKAVAKPKPKPKPVVNTVVTAPAAAATTATTAGAPATSSNPAPATTNTPRPQHPRPVPAGRQRRAGDRGVAVGHPLRLRRLDPGWLRLLGLHPCTSSPRPASPCPRTATGQQMFATTRVSATRSPATWSSSAGASGYAYHVGIYAGRRHDVRLARAPACDLRPARDLVVQRDLRPSLTPDSARSTR